MLLPVFVVPIFGNTKSVGSPWNLVASSIVRTLAISVAPTNVVDVAFSVAPIVPATLAFFTAYVNLATPTFCIAAMAPYVPTTLPAMAFLANSVALTVSAFLVAFVT